MNSTHPSHRLPSRAGRAPRSRRIPAGAVFAVSLLLGLAGPGRAAEGAAPELRDLPLEELMNIPVFAASRYEQKSSEAPSAVTVVTAEQIRRLGWRNLGELLRSVRGFYTTYDRSYGYLGVRGFAVPGDVNTKVLILVDGHRTNDELYNQGYVREDFVLDLDLVDRVEIIRGPSSSLYGSDAFFAVINVITRRGRDLRRVEVSGESGSWDSRRGRLTWGNRFGDGAELLVSGSLYHVDGRSLFFPEFDLPAKNDGVASGLDSERSDHLFAKLVYRDWTLEAARVFRSKKVPTASFGTVFPDPANRQDDESYFAEARLDRTYRSFSVFARFALDSYVYDGLGTVESPLLNPEPPYHVLASNQGMHRALSAETKWTRAFGGSHTGTIGAEYRYVLRERQETYAVDPYFSVVDVSHPARVWALFAQDEARIFPRLILNAGLRHDHYSTFGGTTSPRAAFIWTAARSTTLKILYGQAFRAPNAYELYWNDGGMSRKQSPDLKPERIRTHEAVLEQRLSARLNLIATGYFYRVDNLIMVATDPDDGVGAFANLGKARAWGTEVELVGRGHGGMEGRISGSAQRAEDANEKSELPNSPRLLAKASLILPLREQHLFAGLEAQYVGARDPEKPVHLTKASGYALVNATLNGRNLVGGVDLSASVYNLFDRAYADLGGTEHVQELIPQDGRSYRLKLTYAFR
jgi:iron complex outermembrane receptor protein